MGEFGSAAQGGRSAARSRLPMALWQPVCDAPLAEEPYERLGHWLLAHGRWGEAIAAYLRALSPDGTLLAAYRNHQTATGVAAATLALGKDCLSVRRPLMALACGFQAVALQPDRPEHWGLLGDAWRCLPDALPAVFDGTALASPGDRDRAGVTAYLEALYRDPSYRDAYEGLSAWGRMRDRDDALQCGRKWLPASLLREFADRTWRERSLAAAAAAGTLTETPLHPATVTVLPASRSPLGEPPFETFRETDWSLPPESAIVVPDARLWCDHYTHALFDRDGYLLRGDIALGGVELIAVSPHLPVMETLPGRSAVLAMAGCSMYCHWVLNMLPRLGILEAAGETIAGFDWVLVNGQDLGFQHLSLEMLGVPPEKIVPVNPDRRHLHLEQAIVPSRIDRLRPWMVSFLRDRCWPHARLPDINFSRRLYISRSRAGYRHVIDEDGLIERLYARGFQGICLETFPFDQQVAIMQAAEVIVAPHGAGLTNLVFCRPGTIVLELCSPVYAPHYFWELAHCADLPHYHLIGRDLDEYPEPEAVESERYVDPAADGIWLDVDRVEAALDALGIT